MALVPFLLVFTLHLILLPFTFTAVLGLNLPSDELAIALLVTCHVVVSLLFFRSLTTGALLLVFLGLLVAASFHLSLVQLDPELDAQSYRDLAGRTVLITGPSDLGKAAARAFLQRGATVVFLGRSALDKREVTRHAEQQTRLFGYVVDLSHLLGLADAAELLMEQHPVIDLLVANAGVGGPLSDDPLHQLVPLGYEVTVATNHLAHAFLVDRLLPALRRAASPRVVLVSSRMHEIGTLGMGLDQLTDWTLTFPYDDLSFPAYSRTKLLNLLYARALATNVPEITAVSLSPGTVATRGMPGHHLALFAAALRLPQPAARLLARLLVATQLAFWRRPDVAAQIYLYAAVAPRELVNGQYVDEHMKVRPPSTLVQPQTSDEWAAEVWRATQDAFNVLR